jgi:hypothetical protein
MTHSTTSSPWPSPSQPARGTPKSRKGEHITLRPFPIRWQERPDLPCRDCVPVELADAWDAWAQGRASTALTFDGTKVGGWPYCLQGEVRWRAGERLFEDCQYVLQIGSEEKAGLSWGYGGIGYVARQPGRAADGWHLTWQSL